MGETAVTRGTSSSSRNSLLARARPLVLARLLSAFVTFSIPLVLARVMSLHEYGAYKQLFLLAQTLYYLLTFGVAQSLYYFVPRAPEARAYRVQALAFLLAMGLLGGGAIVAFAPQLGGWFQNPSLPALAIPLALYFAGLLGSYPLEITLTSQGRTGWSAASYLLSDGLRTVAMIAPSLLGFGLHGTMVAIAGFSLVRLAVCWAVLLRGGRGPRFDRALFAEQLRYAAPFGLAIALSVVQQYAHQYAVAALFTPELFALYAVGCFQLPLVDLLYTPMNEVLMVKIGELDRGGSMREGELEALFASTTAKLALAFFPVAAFLCAAAPEFITALFGAKYLGAVPIFRIGVLGIALAAFPIDGVLRGRKKTGRILGSYAVKAAVTLPLLVVAVSKLGLLGGILSSAAGEIVGLVTLMLAVPAALELGNRRPRLLDLIPFRALGFAALCAAISAGAVLALRGPNLDSMFAHAPRLFARLGPLAALGLGFAAVYGSLVALGLYVQRQGERPREALAGRS